MNTKRLCGLSLAAAMALGSLPGAHAQPPPAAGGVSATNAPAPAQHALGLLKPVADKLSA